MTPYVSVIIPAYNEETRICQTLDSIRDYFSAQQYSYEIIISDDGSRDQTVNLARQRLRPEIDSILAPGANRGKGAAIKDGVLAAKGEIVLFSDADLSTPIEEISRFINLHHKSYDVVIGSRALKESNVEVSQNVLRRLMGRIFNGLVQWLACPGIKDTQCGFKSFKSHVAKDLFSRLTFTRFSFDVEILFLADQLGYKINECPVTWRNSVQSRVRIFQDSFGMLLDILKIRWRHRSL